MLHHMGGCIAWKAICQERTSLSSFEAKIRASNEGGKITMDIPSLSDGFTLAGAHLANNSQATLVYNESEATVNWANNVIMKNIRHMELWDNDICE